jgi:hypothetical protein
LNAAPIVLVVATAIAMTAGCGSASHDNRLTDTGPSAIQRVSWSAAQDLIRLCKVRAVEQTHRRTVTLTLRNGRKVFTHEPHIDDVIHALNRVRTRCPPITLATE